MLPKVKSVSLISKSDSAYLEFCRKIRASKNINRGETTPDRKITVSNWIERVLNDVVSKRYKRIEKNIISWQELTLYGSYSKRYRELDGLFQQEKFTIILEVKASISKSSFSKGRSQVNSNLNLVRKIYPNTIAILALVDCRFFDSEFGYAMDQVIETIQGESAYELIKGLNPPEIIDGNNKILWILNESEVQQIASIYGAPYDLDPDFDL